MRPLLVAICVAGARASFAPAPACRHAAPRHCTATIPLMSAAADPLTGVQRRALRAHAGRLQASSSLRRVQVNEMAAAAGALREQLDAAERADEVPLVRCKFARAQSKADVRTLSAELGSSADATVCQARPPPIARPCTRISVRAKRAQVIGRTALLCRPSARALRQLEQLKAAAASADKSSAS